MAERCEKLAADIEKLTTSEMVDNVRTYYYVTDEDGKSVSSDRQREIIEELRREYEESC